MLAAAGACRDSELASKQASCRPERGPATHPDCHGKEGVAGSSPAEGFPQVQGDREAPRIDHCRERG